MKLKKWLTADELPADFYQLVEKPRLYSQREELENAFSAAYEFFHRYEAHPKRKMQQRAVQLMRFVSDANVTVTDAARWAEYDDRVAARLREEYERNVSGGIRHARSADLCRWLTRTKNVVPHRADDLAQAWVKDVPKSDPSPQVAAADDSPVEDVALREPVSNTRPVEQSVPSEPRSGGLPPLLEPISSSSNDDPIPIRGDEEVSTQPEVAAAPEKTAAARPGDNHRQSVPSPPRQAAHTPPSKPVTSGKTGQSRGTPSSPAPPPPRRADPVRQPKVKPPRPPRFAPRPVIVHPDLNELPSGEVAENTASWTVLIILATALVVAMIGTVTAIMMGVFDSPPPPTVETPTAEISLENRPAAETSDEETSDEETSDEETSDEEMSDEEMSDEEMSDEETSDEETSDEETSDEETSDVLFRNRDDSQSQASELAIPKEE